LATLTSVKNRAYGIGLAVSFYFILLLFAAAIGGVVWYFSKNMIATGVTTGVTALLFGFWGFLFHWRTEVAWVCRLQVMLLNIGALPKDFKFFDNASPFAVKDLSDEVVKTATEVVQGAAKELVSQRHTLEKYLGSHASSQAVKSAGPAVGEGRLQKVFILFSDIRGFTSMAEKLTPQETMRVLNQIYTALGIAIEDKGGEINKFIGDAILAYFKRTPENERSEGKTAIKVAIEMQKRFRAAIKNSPELGAKGISIGLGIGIVAGEAIMGNLGTRNRMEFTLIGDSVNLASRLCGIAPEDEILINEELALLVNDQYHIESRQPVQLKGKSEKTIPYSILGDVTHRVSEHLPLQ